MLGLATAIMMMNARDSRQSMGSRNVNISDTERWISSVGGGALGAYGLMRRSLPGAALALAGGYLVYRGVSGYCPTYAALGVEGTGAGKSRIHVQKTVTITKSREELYRFWRDFENLPRFMRHLESVTTSGDARSHWVVKAPMGNVEWDAEITEERPNELIAWRSVDPTDIQHTGSVRFQDAPGGRGTEVHVTLEYRSPAGGAGATMARLFGEEPAQQVGEDLRRFKQVMEAGEIPTTEGQPSGRRSLLGRVLSPRS
jgi:uncharacterized membrane protein